MAEHRYEFRYRAGDVASAQRMRMLHSKQIKVLGAIWVISSLALAVPLLFPSLFPGNPIASWNLVLEIAVIYLVTLLVMMAITPYLDFVFNRFWRLPLQYQFNDRQMRLSVVGGKSKGLRLDWKEIQRADENERVFILYYGAGGKFLILPKSIFDERGMERLKAQLRRLDDPNRRLDDAPGEGALDEGDLDDGLEGEAAAGDAPEAQPTAAARKKKHPPQQKSGSRARTGAKR